MKARDIMLLREEQILLSKNYRSHQAELHPNIMDRVLTRRRMLVAKYTSNSSSVQPRPIQLRP